MKRLWKGCLGLALVLAARGAQAQEMQWRPVAAPQTANPIGVSLRPPEPLPPAHTLPQVSSSAFSQSDGAAPRIVRAQAIDQPYGPGTFPPIPPPPPPPPGPIGGQSGDERYNCAVKTSSKSGQGFWDQTRDTIVGIPDAIGPVFVPATSRGILQSDPCFDWLCSPVTNPFYFADPRSLTEIKPLVIFQRVPSGNSAFQGGDIWFYGVQGSVAINDIFSVWVNKLGAVTTSPGTTANGINDSTGFAEFSLGPKFTFIRNEATHTVMAAGLNFDMAIGNGSVYQNVGDLSLIPYFSIGQGFGKTSYGGFNFLNSTGYSFAIDNERTDFLFSSFHLDFDVANLNKIFPLIELNYFHYTNNGGNGKFFGFEGRDLINFGSGGVAGHDDLSIAAGLRYKFAEWLQLGFAAEFPLLDKDLMNYRLGFDIIFRY